MAHSGSPSGDESPPTEAAPKAAAFEDTILERMAQQNVIQKATNEQLAAIAAILAPLAGNSSDPATTVRKQLFDTYRTAGVETTTNTNAVILARPSSSSDEVEDNKVRDSHERSSKRPSENSGPNEACDLRSKLRQKSQTVDNMHYSNNHISDDLYSVIEESRAKRVESTSIRPHLKHQHSTSSKAPRRRPSRSA
ncbi:hypothetical protein DY000_02014742 [Brassica cretica]|uniref:Uncharacterized protein n=1 Tax=Brassica cretica TaxID=69181 RepID=A0ABQ7D3L0_BRACR|nr:hypothetical protein DY000_02014742 [Brassica cretica]